MSEKKRAVTKRGSASIGALLLIVLIPLAAELLISNFSALSLLFSGAERKELVIKELNDNGCVEVTSSVPLYIEDVNLPMHNISVTFAGERFKYEKIKIAFTDDNFRYDDAFKYNKAEKLMAVGKGCTEWVDLSSYGNAGRLKISCANEVTVRSITINDPPALTFSIVRYFALAAVTSVVVMGLWRSVSSDSREKLLKIITAAICALVAGVTAFIGVMCNEPLLFDMPENVTKADQYTQLFDAFENGRLDLDIDYDTAKLDELQNVYDRSERNEKHIHGACWDRVYYGGKFYSYFGAAPIFTVYYPVRILTGAVASPLLACCLLCIYSVLFISLFYRLLLRHFCDGAPVFASAVGLLAVLFGSLIFAAAIEAQFYFTAVLSGISSTAAYLYFVFDAYFAGKQSKRVLCLIFAGISASLCAASRPTMLLYCFVGLIPLICMLKEKDKTPKQKMICLSAIAVPVLVGAALIMAYNAARFNDPLEFGFNYQVTVSRARANTFKLSLIPGMIYHFFLQQPKFSASFPYITMKTAALESYTRYNYNGVTIGVLSIPASFGLFLLPFSLSKKKRFRSWTLMSLTIAAFLMAFIDMCKAGAHYRYVCDIAFVLLIVAVISSLHVLSRLRTSRPGAYVKAYALICAAFAATIVMGTLLFFNNEGNTMMDDYAAAAAYLRML